MKRSGDELLEELQRPEERLKGEDRGAGRNENDGGWASGVRPQGGRSRHHREFGEVPENKQANFSDPESRIMKAGNGNHFEQAYNAQAAVEVESLLIVGQRVSQAPNDKEQLVPTLQAIPSSVGRVEGVLVDSGFCSEAAVGQVERSEGGQPTGTTVYAALEKTSHHRSVEDLEKKAEPPAVPEGSPVLEVLQQRMKTRAGKAKYKLRQQTVEPVFGIIKSVIGFRRFLLRGLEKVSLEWTWVSVAYNLKRLHRMNLAG